MGGCCLLWVPTVNNKQKYGTGTCVRLRRAYHPCARSAARAETATGSREGVAQTTGSRTPDLPVRMQDLLAENTRAPTPARMLGSTQVARPLLGPGEEGPAVSCENISGRCDQAQDTLVQVMRLEHTRRCRRPRFLLSRYQDCSSCHEGVDRSAAGTESDRLNEDAPWGGRVREAERRC